MNMTGTYKHVGSRFVGSSSVRVRAHPAPHIHTDTLLLIYTCNPNGTMLYIDPALGHQAPPTPPPTPDNSLKTLLKIQKTQKTQIVQKTQKTCHAAPGPHAIPTRPPTPENNLKTLLQKNQKTQIIQIIQN